MSNARSHRVAGTTQAAQDATTWGHGSGSRSDRLRFKKPACATLVSGEPPISILREGTFFRSSDYNAVTKQAAEEWVGRAIWQIAPDGSPVAFDVIGFTRQPGAPLNEPDRFMLHLLRDCSQESRSSWDASRPAFSSAELAREYTLTIEDREHLAEIERAAYARRGFGSNPILWPQPIQLDIFGFADEPADHESEWSEVEDQTPLATDADLPEPWPDDPRIAFQFA